FEGRVGGGGADLEGVNVTVAPLQGPKDATLPAPRLYREHYLQVTQPTPRSKAPPGWWPDALIPFAIPASERLPGPARFTGAPFAVQAGRNQPVYAEVRIPERTPPGEYRGQVIVTAHGQKPRRLSLRLTVWDITLPRTPACQSNFGSFGRAARQAGLPEGSPEARALI